MRLLDRLPQTCGVMGDGPDVVEFRNLHVFEPLRQAAELAGDVGFDSPFSSGYGQSQQAEKD